MTVEFVRPELLYLLLLLPFWWLLVWPWAPGGVLFTRGGDPARGHGGRFAGPLNFVLWLPRLIRLGVLVSLVIALAHPQRVDVAEETVLRGKSIALALDISTSMLANDMGDESTRLEVARDAAVRFAVGRERDELSLIAFAGGAVTRIPPTTDSDLVVAGVESLQVQQVLDGTDISSAVLASLARLLESEREDRVIVLLTDGAHNGTGVAPLVTAQAAARLGVRVHSIALLSDPDADRLAAMSAPLRRATLARQGLVEAEIETVLTGISRLTGGNYFRASSEAALDSIYSTIGQIEAPVEVAVPVEVRSSLRVWILLASLLLVGLDAALRGSRWGLVP
jgi:Ca-activated chloride channel family protein